MRSPHPLSLVLSLLVLAGGSLFAYAQMEVGDDRLIPYRGRLEADGAPANGAYDLRFALFSTQAAAAECLVAASPGNCGFWWGEHAGVPVHEGAFAVELGATAPLGDTVLAQPALYLAIAVRPAGQDPEPPYTLLAGKQHILPVPFATRAATATNYEVNGELYVATNAYLNDGTNPLKVSGNWTDYANTFSGTPSNRAEIANDTGGYKKLMIVGNKSGDGATRRVGIWDHLDVHGPMTTIGDIRNTAADGQVAVSSGFAFRDTGDEWLRLRTGPGSETYAPLAVQKLYTHEKLVRFLRFDLNEATSHFNTNVSTATHTCAIGGIAFQSGDIQEQGTVYPMAAYTYPLNGWWHIGADFASHNDHENKVVGVVCFHHEIVSFESWFQ